MAWQLFFGALVKGGLIFLGSLISGIVVNGNSFGCKFEELLVEGSCFLGVGVITVAELRKVLYCLSFLNL
jgi:hypothetical protein